MAINRVSRSTVTTAPPPRAAPLPLTSEPPAIQEVVKAELATPAAVPTVPLGDSAVTLDTPKPEMEQGVRSESEELRMSGYVVVFDASERKFTITHGVASEGEKSDHTIVKLPSLSPEGRDLLVVVMAVDQTTTSRETTQDTTSPETEQGVSAVETDAAETAASESGTE